MMYLHTDGTLIEFIEHSIYVAFGFAAGLTVGVVAKLKRFPKIF